MKCCGDGCGGLSLIVAILRDVSGMEGALSADRDCD